MALQTRSGRALLSAHLLLLYFSLLQILATLNFTFHKTLSFPSSHFFLRDMCNGDPVSGTYVTVTLAPWQRD
jgi:hypothetical protein